MKLIEKIEAAKEETQRSVIYDALVWAHKNEHITDGKYDLAIRFLNAGAYLDAAMQLVPEGWWWVLNSGVTAPATALLGTRDNPGVRSMGATPALAFCAACLRAMGGDDAE